MADAEISVEVGVKNVARPVTFTTTESKESVTEALTQALTNKTVAKLTASDGRIVLLAGSEIGYVVINAQGERHVGFGFVDA